jgi:fatty acid desaturase
MSGQIGPFQEADGAISMRRILAAFFSLAAVALGGYAIPGALGWWVFLPSALCLAGALLLMFFTTWADVAALISAAKRDRE